MVHVLLQSPLLKTQQPLSIQATFKAQPIHQTIPFTIISNKSAPTGQSNGGYGTMEGKDYLKYTVTLE